MTTIGWVFILFAGVLIRSISRGRIEQLPGDLGDFMTAIFTGNSVLLKEVADRKGTGLNATDPTVVPTTDNTGTSSTSGLVTEVKKLGDSAKGYRWGATGPDYYDCSGLVWRAVKNLGIYTGIRFTTYSFAAQSSRFSTRTTSPVVGDIVVWENHHMGVVDGSGTFYSALNPKTGIKTLSIDTMTSEFRINPQYYHLTGKVT